MHSYEKQATNIHYIHSTNIEIEREERREKKPFIFKPLTFNNLFEEIEGSEMAHNYQTNRCSADDH